MATDHTPPRSQLIVLYGVLSVLVLVALKFVLDSYYTNLTDAQVASKVLKVPARELKAIMAEQRRQLQAGVMSIDHAKLLYIKEGRMGLSALSPQASTDPRPLAGWNHFPHKQLPHTAVSYPTATEMKAASETQEAGTVPIAAVSSATKVAP